MEGALSKQSLMVLPKLLTSEFSCSIVTLTASQRNGRAVQLGMDYIQIIQQEFYEFESPKIALAC
jgi:hypothetical protein